MAATRLRKLILPVRVGLLAVLFSLTACGPKVNDANLAKIEVGMSDKQVEDILGKPDSVSTGYVMGMKKVTLTYRAKSPAVSVVLMNDQVISRPGKLNPK